MSQDVDRVGQVHQQQPADCGIESLLVDEAARVAVAKLDVGQSQPVATLVGDADLGGVLLNADN